MDVILWEMKTTHTRIPTSKAQINVKQKINTAQLEQTDGIFKWNDNWCVSSGVPIIA